MPIGHIVGFTLNNNPILWKKREDGSLICLFTIREAKQQRLLTPREKIELASMIQNSKWKDVVIQQGNDYLIETKSQTNINFLPILDNGKSREELSDAPPIPRRLTQTARSTGTLPGAEKTDSPHKPELEHRNSAPLGLFQPKVPSELSVKNIITCPVAGRKSTCYNGTFVAENLETLDTHMSSHLMTKPAVFAILPLAITTWILSLRQEQMRLITYIFDDLIAPACGEKIKLEPIIKAYFKDQILLGMDDNNHATWPTPFEQMPSNQFATQQLFIKGLRAACRASANSNYPLFNFLIDDRIPVEEMHPSPIIGTNLNFMRCFISEKEGTLKQIQSTLKQLVELSMMTGLIERMRKLLMRQFDTESKPTALEEMQLSSYLMETIIGPNEHSLSPDKICIDLSVLEKLFQLIHKLAPEMDGFASDMLRHIKEPNLTYHSFCETVFLTIRGTRKDEQTARDEVKAVFQELIKQLNANASDMDGLAMKLNPRVDTDCFLTAKAHGVLKVTLQPELTSPSLKRKSKHPRLSEKDITTLVETFIENMRTALKIRPVSPPPSTEPGSRDMVTRA